MPALRLIIKTNMKAIRVSHTGGPEVLELAEVSVPQAKPAEAVVKVHVAGVNSIDAQFRDGRLRTPVPFIPGQEGEGVVTAIGTQAKSVEGWRPRGLERDSGILCGICRRARRTSCPRARAYSPTNRLRRR